MRELRIEEQKSICGGTHYVFTDKTTGLFYAYEDMAGARRRRYLLMADGHKVSGITTMG